MVEEKLPFNEDVWRRQDEDALVQRQDRAGLLRDGVSKGCFATFLFAAMMAIAGLVFINASQTYVIVDILDYPRAQVGQAAGTLAFADELLSLPMASVWGALSDRLGRRWIFSLGLTIMAMATILYPWATCVFPDGLSTFFRALLSFRLLFALGASASTAMLTALIGDYARASSRAKVAGITGFSTGVGAVFAALILNRLPTFFTRSSTVVPGSLRGMPNGGATLVISFSVTGILLLMAAIVVGLFLKKAPDLGMNEGEESLKMPLIERLKFGLSAIKHPAVALAYASGFVARADSIALTLFITPWVDKYMTAEGLCPPQDPEILTKCEPAKRLASTLMSISHATMLLGAPIFGILCDRMGALHASIIPAASGLLSFGTLFFLPNPRMPLVYLAMACAGFADIGMIIASTVLIANLSSPQHRGALAGVYSLFGALGIIITSKLGGYLFDIWKETAAFVVVAVPSGLVLAGILLVINQKKSPTLFKFSKDHCRIHNAN